MTILVTGASGLIGSHLCRRLVSEGYPVVGLVHNTVNPRLLGIPAAQPLEIERCDIRDSYAVSAIVRKHNVKTVFHLAAHLPHTTNPDFVKVNVIGTANLLDACHHEQVKSFIYASSMSVYSTPPEYLPIGEEHPTRPDSDYGCSKLIGELICDCYSAVLRTIAIRYSSVFGVGDSSRAAYHFIQAALAGQVIQVDGDGSQSSDFIHVSDAVDGALLAMAKGRSDQIYNIGGGQETSVLELANLIANLFDPVAKVAMTGKPTTRPFRFVADIGKARSELGYSPSPLLQGLIKYQEEMNDKR